jgi:Tol biopolymer transport system component
MAATAVAALLATFFAWDAYRRPWSPPPVARPMKLSLSLPEKSQFRHIAISPDGAWLAFTGYTGNARHLWTLALATGETNQIAGSEGAQTPFWSPDSHSIGFFASGKLKKVEIAGGLPVTLCSYRGAVGAAWGRAGVILLAALGGGDLSRVSAAGGPVTSILGPDPKRLETDLRHPSFLPDGRHFLYSVLSIDKEVRGIYLGSLDGGASKRLLGDTSNVSYVASGAPPDTTSGATSGMASDRASDTASVTASVTDGAGKGYLLFGREGALMAQPFDAKRLRLDGEPFPVASQVATIPGTDDRRFTVSENGVLVFDPSLNRQRKQALLVDRGGKIISSPERLDNLRLARLAPGGERFMATRYDPETDNFDLWLSDMTGGNAVRFTFDPGNDQFAVWSPDASRVVWAANRGGHFQLYEKAVDQTGQETPLWQSDYHKFPTDWSRDGRYIIYRQIDPKTKFDIWALPLFGERKPFPVLQSESNESSGALSPDGQWLAYYSDESGRYEIYVQRFPGGDKRRISTEGGTWPYWRGDGKELYYHAFDGKVMATPVTGGTSLAFGAPFALFEFRSGNLPEQPYYSVDRDGRRFLLNADVESEINSPLTVMVNWTAGVKR